jgi:hypothetical protein
MSESPFRALPIAASLESDFLVASLYRWWLEDEKEELRVV